MSFKAKSFQDLSADGFSYAFVLIIADHKNTAILVSVIYQ